MSKQLDIIKEIAIKAGNLALEKQKEIKKLNIEIKKDGSPVTAADLECEELIKKELDKYFEGFSFLGEESGEEKHDSDYQWIIDPIDGTSNFLRGMKSFACCICLQEKGQTIVSVIYFPALDELYYASREKDGAFLEFPNSKEQATIKLNASNKINLSDSLISYGLGKSNFEQTLGIIKKVQPKSAGTRILGCSCIDMIKVARGEFGAFMKLSIYPWDIFPESYIAQKAGAKLYNNDCIEITPNSQYNPKTDGCIVSNPNIIEEIKELTKPTMEIAGEKVREVYEDKICPLAHKAVETSSPYVKEACDKSKPYLKSSVEFTKNTATKAKPYCVKAYNTTKTACKKSWPHIVKAGVATKNGTCKAVKFIKNKIKK